MRIQENRYFDLSLVPLLAYLISIIAAHGGNDKAPLLVIAVSFLSLIAGFAYFLVALLGTHRKVNLTRASISLVPFSATAILVVLARAGFVDTLPILGFR